MPQDMGQDGAGLEQQSCQFLTRKPGVVTFYTRASIDGSLRFLVLPGLRLTRQLGESLKTSDLYVL